MSATSNPAKLTASSRRHPGSRGSQRVSDAERAEIADQLSTHYGEGRLDQEEFGQRLDQAMAAKTYQDLAGLLSDLPHPGDAAGLVRPARRRGRQRGLRSLALLVVLAIALAASVHAVAWALTPILWAVALGAIAILALRRLGRRQ